MLKVYYSDISNCVLDDNLILTLPHERKVYVSSINDKCRKKQSLFVWKLFEKALELNQIKIDKFNLLDSGEWVCLNSKIKFSLSHSKNIVAVSISDFNVGIDVEECSRKLLKVKNKFLLSDNNEELSLDLLAKLWTEKECKYKAKFDGIMSNIMLTDLEENRYILSVCGCERIDNIIKIEI